ncbi:MAG TPA: ABC transporter substrate-binding protein, partial [Pyrinomonadaceae bacterium]|nr:ABC transporter substrate-binding protein [Pyrinomonadaceae bacterium]
MKPQKRKAGSSSWQLAGSLPANKLTAYCFCLLLLFLTSCNEIQKPKTEPFYAQTTPPPKQEFRWSNGKMPKSFDPALAAAPPETDIIRAVFEGLTETDTKTLQPTPGVAEKWTHSEDFKTWTFNLRKDAKWSNGKAVTAADFVRSWKRLAEMGDKVSHYKFLSNIVGMQVLENETAPKVESQEIDLISKQSANQTFQFSRSQPNSNTAVNAAPKLNSNSVQTEIKTDVKPEEKQKSKEKKETKFGVEAVDDYTLKVTLIKPDKDFPALASNPVLRPVYGDGKEFENGKLNADVVTNGAFRIFSVGQDGVTLDRAEHYWNRKEVELERVRFVPTENAEKALEAYRAGEV